MKRKVIIRQMKKQVKQTYLRIAKIMLNFRSPYFWPYEQFRECFYKHYMHIEVFLFIRGHI